MIRYIFAFVMLVHGLIHFMGFAKAFGYGNISQITTTISRASGVLWMMNAFLFVAAVVFYLLNNHWWWIVALIAAVLSQALIIQVWQFAKFGTIANILILVMIVIHFISKD